MISLLISNTIFGVAEVGKNEKSATNATIIGEHAVAAVGENVTVTINLVNNPGIIAMKLLVSFDTENLTLVKVTDAGVLGTQYHKPELVSPYTLSWGMDTATENCTVNGTIATLEFAVSEDVETGTKLPIEISYDLNNYDICDYDGNIVEFAVEDGSITVGTISANPIEDFDYELSGSEMIITEYIGTAAKVIIGDTYVIDGEEYTVVEIAEFAFEANDNVTSVVIPDTVKVIGDYAFYDCHELTEVTIYSKDVVFGECSLGYYYISKREDGIVEGFTIYGYAGSTAEEYASTVDEITFVEIKEEEEPAIKQATVETIALMEETNTSVNVKLTGAGTYQTGATVTVSAGSRYGFQFSGWYVASDNGYTGTALSTEREYSFVVEQDVTLVAVYKYIGTGRLRVFGAGFKVNGGVTQTIYNYVQDFTIGEKVTLTATDNNFAYWMNESNKIVSEDKEITFTIARDVMYTAVYKNADINSAYVEFVSYYGQVMQAQNYNSDSDIQIPGAANRDGYQFITWSMTAEEIRSQISEGATYIRVTPIYEALPGVFTVTTVYDGDELNADIVEGFAGYQFKTVSAKRVEGRTFSHWSDTVTGENILSTSESYSIYINQNTTIYAIYVEEGIQVAKQPTMVTNGISAKLLDETTKSVVVLATRDIIEGYSLIEHGIIYSGNSAYGLAGATDTMIIGAAGVAKGVSTATATRGTYAHTITLTEQQLDIVVYARGYMILEDSEGNQRTVYGEIVSGSYYSLQQH